MDTKMIEEMLEHVNEIAIAIDNNFDEDLAVIEELTHNLKEELETMIQES